MITFFSKIVTGFDFSDGVLHMVTLAQSRGEVVPIAHAEIPFPEEGIHHEVFVPFLKKIRTQYKLKRICLASPTVPIASYRDMCKAAGFIVVSNELETVAIARALLASKKTGTALIVHIGDRHTDSIRVVDGVITHESIIAFGGEMLVTALVEALSIPIEEAHRIKREYGLSASREHKDMFNGLIPSVSILREDISRLTVAAPVATVYLSGPHGAMKGLSEYLSTALKLVVVTANPWVNCVSFNTTIPMLNAEDAMRYSAAIGAALGQFLPVRRTTSQNNAPVVQ